MNLALDLQDVLKRWAHHTSAAYSVEAMLREHMAPWRVESREEYELSRDEIIGVIYGALQEDGAHRDRLEGVRSPEDEVHINLAMHRLQS
jgi:hypothetical protein